MCKFFRADVCQHALDLRVRHYIPLVKVTHGSGQFAVRTAKLKKDIISSYKKSKPRFSFGQTLFCQYIPSKPN